MPRMFSPIYGSLCVARARKRSIQCEQQQNIHIHAMCSGFSSVHRARISSIYVKPSHFYEYAHGIRGITTKTVNYAHQNGAGVVFALSAAQTIRPVFGQIDKMAFVLGAQCKKW